MATSKASVPHLVERRLLGVHVESLLLTVCDVVEAMRLRQHEVANSAKQQQQTIMT